MGLSPWGLRGTPGLGNPKLPAVRVQVGPIGKGPQRLVQPLILQTGLRPSGHLSFLQGLPDSIPGETFFSLSMDISLMLVETHICPLAGDSFCLGCLETCSQELPGYLGSHSKRFL